MITFPPYPDEQITRDITARIWNERAFDTNWRRAPEVARYYAGDQFNFSSGILAAQPIAALASAASGGRYQVSDLPPLRLASSLYTVTAFVFFFLAFRLLFGQASALLAAVSQQRLRSYFWIRCMHGQKASCSPALQSHFTRWCAA